MPVAVATALSGLIRSKHLGPSRVTITKLMSVQSATCTASSDTFHLTPLVQSTFLVTCRDLAHLAVYGEGDMLSVAEHAIWDAVVSQRSTLNF